MKRIIALFAFVYIGVVSYGQSVGIGTDLPENTAQLDISSTTKGVLIPRMTAGQRMGIISPATGLLVYQSDVTDSSFYWYDGLAWIKLQSAKSGWGINGNLATSATSNFIGTIDNTSLQFRVNNLKAGTLDPINKNVLFGTRAGLNLAATAKENTLIGDSVFTTDNLALTGNVAIGYGAQAQTTLNVNFATVVGWSAAKNNRGSWATIIGSEAGMTNQAQGNVIIGSSAGKKNLTGFQNTFVGDNAGRENTTGISNAFFGSYAGATNSGSQNAFFGSLSGVNSVSGSANAFFGEQTGLENLDGSSNNFFGYRAGKNNTSGSYNVFVGHEAGSGNTTGRRSIAVGTAALFSMAGGTELLSVAIGDSAGFSNTTSENMFVGGLAGKKNTSGYSVTFIGTRAGYTNSTGWSNTAVGTNALFANTTASFSTAIGDRALQSNTTGNFNTAVGSGSLQATSVQAANTAVGFESLTNNTGANNTAVGSGALRTNTGQGNNTAVGSNADVANVGIANAAAFGSNTIVGSSNTMAFGNANTVGWGFGRSTVAVGTALQVGQAGFGNGNGAYASTGGTWVNSSDENLKENLQIVNGAELLNKINQLQITQWDYKGTIKETHIGPMAQQFKLLFGLGTADNDKGISTIDPAGIALVGIQELTKQNALLKQVIEKQQLLINEILEKLKR